MAVFQIWSAHRYNFESSRPDRNGTRFWTNWLDGRKSTYAACAIRLIPSALCRTRWNIREVRFASFKRFFTYLCKFIGWSEYRNLPVDDYWWNCTKPCQSRLHKTWCGRIRACRIERRNRNHQKNSRPKLVICLYHKPEDLLKFNLFKSLVPEYKMHLAHSSCGFTDTILYAKA